MAKVLYNDEWYEQLSTEALYEEEYERILEEHADSLFPTYKFVKFKKTVYSEDGAAKADFALVHRKYREWWVVEAELSHHSFEHHVRPQIETLSRAIYGEEEARYLHAQEPMLDLDRMCSMVKGHQPGVLVIVNAPRNEWAQEFKRYGVLVTVLEIFRSRYNKYLYRLNGDQPVETGIQSSVCTVELSRMLRLDSPGILPIANGEKIAVLFRSGVTEWSRIDIQNGVYLTSAKPISLNSRMRYELVELEDKSFALYESK
jgi:hypothetical protein